MVKLTILFVLSAFLMVQLIQARHGPRGFVLWNFFEDGVRERLPLRDTIAQTSLVNTQMKEITRILKETVIATTEVFRKVVKEGSESEHQSPEFRTQLATLTAFTESVGRMLQAPEHAQLTWIFEEFEELVHIIGRYHIINVANFSKEENYFNRLLDEKGMNSVERMLSLSGKSFVQSFDKDVADYIASLTTEQRTYENEFITEYQKTTEDEDYDNMCWFETVLARFRKLPQ